MLAARKLKILFEVNGLLKPNGGAFRVNSELSNPLKTDAVTASKTLLGLKKTLDMTILALRNSSQLPFALVM